MIKIRWLLLLFIRVDGQVMNISGDWDDRIGDDSVKLDVKHNTEKGEDTGLVIISLQFKSGVYNWEFIL